MKSVLTRAELVDALRRVGEGDRQAFDSVYRATSAKLTGAALRIVNDRALAEDIVQESYAAVWRQAGRFDPKRGSPITWLVAIVRNRAIDRLRAPAMRTTTMPIDEALNLVDDTPPADASIQATEEARMLHECLDGLENPSRDAIRAAFFEDITYDALAKREAVPLGTMKTWIRRGLLRLGERLER